MSHDAGNFIAKCLTGAARIDEIDDYADLWHESDSSESLAQFLGLTDEEYALWVEKPDALPEILRVRTSGLAVDRPHAFSDH